MGDIEGTYVPDSDAEWALLAELRGLTQTAHEAGVEDDDIIACLSFVAAGIALADEPEDVPEPSESEDEEEPEKTEECPECGTEIDDVLASMGGGVQVEPCGCMMHMDDLDGWVERPGEDDNGD